jgi:ATP-dependent exoDNAse (exonuclease V) alpha subunit
MEYLRTLRPAGLSPGELRLKHGCPIILMRNLAPRRGLCNGTRLIVVNVGERVLEARIIGGNHDGELAFIPRLTLSPSNNNAEFSFKLNRRQFPVRLAFSMSINKAQGQSVKFVGLDLRIPIFAHGQLYVALSRATSPHHIHVLLPPDASGRTTNIVYPEVLLTT